MIIIAQNGLILNRVVIYFDKDYTKAEQIYEYIFKF